MKKTITRTFSVEDVIFKEFETICKEKKLNKSKIIQKCIKNFIVDEFDFEGKIFNLKIEGVYDPITIIKKENNMLYLSDDNILNYFTFKQMYEELDSQVQAVKDWIDNTNSDDDDELIDIVSEDFLQCSIDPDKVLEKLEKLDKFDKFDTSEKIELNEPTRETYKYGIDENEQIDPNEFLKCNIPLEKVQEYIENIDEDKIDYEKAPGKRVKYFYHMDEDEIKKISEKLLKQEYKNDIFHVTDLYKLDGIEIRIFDNTLNVFYDEKVYFDTIGLIRLLNKTIKDNENIINIKFIEYNSSEYKDMFIKISNETLSFSNFKTIDDKTRLIKIEEFIKSKYKLTEFDIMTLENVYSVKKENEGRITYMLNVNPMMIRCEEFIKDLNKYLIAGDKMDVNGKNITPFIMFNLEKYPSVQNFPIDYDRELEKLKDEFKNDELKLNVEIEKLNEDFDEKISSKNVYESYLKTVLEK